MKVLPERLWKDVMRQSLTMAEVEEDFTLQQGSHIPMNRNDLLWTVTTVLALAIVIALAFLNWRGVQTTNRRAIETRNLAGHLRRILQLTDEAETGQRGYLLTAENAYLEPYTNAVRKLPAEIGKLQASTEGRHYQHEFQELRQLITDKMAELKQTIELRRGAGFSAALAVVQTNRGKQIMDRIRALTVELEDDIDADANAQAREVTNRARDAALITSAAVLTLFTLFALAAYQIRQQREMAEASSRAKGAFLASMSHELRTPLNAIIGYSEMLVEEAQDAAQSSLIPDLTKIQLAGKHLLMLINSVLDLSKIEAGKMDLYVESFCVSTLVEEVSSVIRPLAEKNGNQLHIQIAPDIGSIHNDQTKLRQTLYNLLSNACKFTQNGSVTFTARREGSNGQEHLVFTVSDTGIGMTPAQVQQLFQPFTQADSSVSRRFGGTGLGLALSQNFVQMLGGTLSVESRPQVGSTFTVRILVSTVGAEARDAQTIAPEPAPATGSLILAIDDEPTVGELLSRSLAKQGFRVHPAYTGEEGIRLARKLRPAAITLDVMMPGMDGWTVLSVLKADQELSEIPVIMLTINDNQNLGYTLGATDYLSKPIDRERLLSVLMRYRSTEPASALVVEDDADSRELLRRALEGEGWKVRTAENGRAALAAVAEQRPGVILLDLMMPEMDGFEFVSLLRQQPEGRNIPIIVITAKDLSAEERLRLNGYVSRVLQKGAFQVEDLLSEVSRLVITRVRKSTG